MVGYGGTAPPLLGSKPRVLLSYSYPLVHQAGMRCAIALSYPRSANCMAVGAAIAPALLSFEARATVCCRLEQSEVADGRGNAPRSRESRVIQFSRLVQPTCICLPSMVSPAECV